MGRREIQRSIRIEGKNAIPAGEAKPGMQVRIISRSKGLVTPEKVIEVTGSRKTSQDGNKAVLGIDTGGERRSIGEGTWVIPYSPIEDLGNEPSFISKVLKFIFG